MELWSLKPLKKFKILYENIEGILRNSIIILTSYVIAAYLKLSNIIYCIPMFTAKNVASWLPFKIIYYVKLKSSLFTCIFGMQITQECLQWHNWTRAYPGLGPGINNLTCWLKRKLKPSLSASTMVLIFNNNLCIWSHVASYNNV